MSDRMSPHVREWMKRTEVRPPDAEESARQVVSRLPEVRQRRRWWPFPVIYRRPQMTGATDTIGSKSRPIQAMDGHTPTAIERTHTMFSPAKAITAGAIVFSLGAALLIAQPFDRGSSIPGVEAETPAPVPFTARFNMAGQASQGESEVLSNGVERTSRVAWRANSVEASDPRFEGTWTWTITWDTYPEVEFNTGAGRIQTEEGAWQELPERFFNWTDGRNTPADNLMAEGETAQRVFIGEGGYEGLVAVAIETAEADQGAVWSLEGYILDGDLPPLPEPYVEES